MEIQRVQRAALWVAPFRDTRGFYPSLINIPRVNERHAVSTIFVRLRKPTVYSLVTISGRRRKKKLYLLSCRGKRGKGYWQDWAGFGRVEMKREIMKRELSWLVQCGMEFDEWYLLFFYFLIDEFFSLKGKKESVFVVKHLKMGIGIFFNALFLIISKRCNNIFPLSHPRLHLCKKSQFSSKIIIRVHLLSG